MTSLLSPAWVAVLKSLMIDAGMTEAELARKTDIPQATINRILLGGTKDPRISTMLAIANVFGVTIGQLIGEELLQPLDGRDKHHSKQCFIPIIEWHDILAFTLSNEIDTYTHSDWILIDRGRIDGCFALRTTPSMEPKFRRGSTIIVEPNAPLKDHHIVIVSLNRQEPTVRRIEKDGGDIYFVKLKALRDDLSVLRRASDQIIGVITETRITALDF